VALKSRAAAYRRERVLMAGLMTAKPDMPDQQATKDQAAATSEGGAPATPEEQAQYELVVKNGMKLIYADNAMPHVLDLLKGGGDPIMGLASATATIVLKLQESANQAGQPIDGDVLYHAGAAILEDLANLAKEAGIHEFTQAEIEQATYKALDLYREQASQKGELDQNAVQSDWNNLVAADKAGQQPPQAQPPPDQQPPGA
jgi:hypothetical protein